LTDAVLHVLDGDVEAERGGGEDGNVLLARRLDQLHGVAGRAGEGLVDPDGQPGLYERKGALQMDLTVVGLDQDGVDLADELFRFLEDLNAVFAQLLGERADALLTDE